MHYIDLEYIHMYLEHVIYFFWCGPFFFKFLLNLLQYCFCCFYVLGFWPWGMWDLSFLTRDWTLTPCIERQSLNHWITREVPRICALGYIYIHECVCVFIYIHKYIAVMNKGWLKISRPQIFSPLWRCLSRQPFTLIF